MQNIREITEHPTSYKGSEATRAIVEAEIARRWGDIEKQLYDPYTNCRTYAGWLSVNRRVKKGETGIRSYTILEQQDENGNVIKRHRRGLILFYIRQTEAV